MDHQPPGPLGRIHPTIAVTVALVFAFLWGSTVLGVAVALTENAPAAPWIVVPFGALPLWGVYRLLSGMFERPSKAVTPRDRASEAPLSPGGVGELTEREREVLALLSTGRTNGEIARELYITGATVKSHVNAILRKTGARNRLEAVAIARSNGHRAEVQPG